MGGEGTRTATFARLDDFHHGLEKMIGLPNARVYDGMKAEHCHRADSDDVFTTSNYGLDTTSRREWEFVVSPGPGLYPGEADRGAHDPHKRVRQSIADLLEHPKIQAAALSKVELIALRLYTGPMFMKYNAVLRGFPQAVIDKCKGNRYVTTLHAIVSGVRKLAQVEELPKGRTVFRGLGGMMLPEAFHQPDEFGCRGGVEFAFLSTTTKREVAVQYSGTGAGLPTIFEIAVGQVDRGASLKVLSQYAGEEEILMPPLSNLEVVGDAWMDEGCMVVPLRINVNLKSATIDELVERRKLLHMDMLHNLTSEAALALENHALSANLLHGSLLHALVVAAGQRLMDEYRSKGSEHGARDPEEFNEDAKYKLLINEAVDYKRQALSIHTSIVFRARILQGVIDPNCESASPATDPQQQRAVDPRQQSMPMRTSSAAQARKIVDLDLHSLAVGDVGARSAHNRNLCRAIHAQTASDAAAL